MTSEPKIFILQEMAKNQAKYDQSVRDAKMAQKKVALKARIERAMSKREEG